MKNRRYFFIVALCIFCVAFATAAVAADVCISPVSASAVSGESVDVEVCFSSTVPMWGVSFEITAPDGFTLTGVTPALGAAADAVPGDEMTGFSLFCDDSFGNPYRMTILRLDNVSLVVEDTALATLTYAVADSVRTGDYAITVTPLEAYDAAEHPLTISAPAATVAVTHTHILFPVSAVAATCTAAGNQAYYICTTCAACFKGADAAVETTAEAETLPARGHTPTELPAVAPTCTESGLTAGTKCTVCNAILTAQAEIPARGHTPTELPAVAPTCTESGLTAGAKCTVCNAILTAQAEIPARGHTPTALPAVAPTCTESGLTAGAKCTVCNAILTAQEEIPALGHDMLLTAAAAPTASAAGNNAYYTCLRCGGVFKDAAGETETTPEAEILPMLLPVTYDLANGSVTVFAGSAVTAIAEESVSDGDAFAAVSARAGELPFEMYALAYSGAPALDGSAAFALDIPFEMDAENIKVYRVCGDFITDLHAEVGEDGKLHFTADHLDRYIICAGELVRYGDANGDGSFTLADTLRLLRNLSDGSVALDKAAADISGDEVLSLLDVLMILQKALHR